MKNYAIDYNKKILSEIEIINPKLIVCCGKGLKEIIETVYKLNEKQMNRQIIEIYHPSYYFIKENNYYKLFIEQAKNINGTCNTNEVNRSINES